MTIGGGAGGGRDGGVSEGLRVDAQQTGEHFG